MIANKHLTPFRVIVDCVDDDVVVVDTVVVDALVVDAIVLDWEKFQLLTLLLKDSQRNEIFDSLLKILRIFLDLILISMAVITLLQGM